MYVTSNDLFYADQWPQPRLGSKAWTVCFEAIFQEVYGYEPKYIKYGKPESIAYDFAEQMIGEKCKKDGIEISNYYMIGDNPLSDIEGANRRGEENFKKTGVNNWRSILVKTGVWQEGADTNNATYVVEDMKAAYDLILNEEGLE